MISALNFAKKIFGSGNYGKIEKFNIKYLKKFKVTVFCPESHTEKIAKAMSSAGAGVIGKYSECSFRIKGKGTFRGGKGTNPYTGKKGKLEFTDEIRLEMICSSENLNSVINAMVKTHPYEEPAYDIYEVLSGLSQKTAYAVKITLKNPVNAAEIFNKINSRLEIGLIPESWKKGKIKYAVVNLEEGYDMTDYIKNKTQKTLYITKNFKKRINIRLV
jgi:hypothetical protein